MVIQTKKKREVIDITDEINSELCRLKAGNGICNIFLKHTTAALTTADLDPGGTDLDYLEALDKIVPRLKYRHPHDPEHMPDHILSSLIGTSLTIPVKDGKLILGTWQRVTLIEFDGPRERELIISFTENS